MVINKRGGRITNLNTGKVVKLYERLGVYFMKAKILPPSNDMPPTSKTDWSNGDLVEMSNGELGFARRG